MDRVAQLLLRATRVVPHTDADGLAAGALALRARGESGAAAVLLGRGETPFADPRSAGSAVLDWGVRAFVHPPAIVVDHHAPEADAGDDTVVVSGYRARPEVSTSVLVHRLLPEQPVWLAAVGAYGDLGDRAFALPELVSLTKAPIKQLAALVNAPRRLPSGPVDVALDVLVDADDARGALRDPRVAALEAARDEWQTAYRSALRTAPRVGATAALVRVRSPYQLHPLLATTWARRLSPRVVVAANDDYLPGRVNFAVRGGDGDLRDLLRRALPDEPGEYAHGHPRATGGSLTPARFDALLDALGVPK